MKVVNFNQKIFESFLHEELKDFLIENSSVLIIGIKEGGIPIAEMVKVSLEKITSTQLDFITIKCQRPSTKSKKKSFIVKYLLKNLFKVLPQFFLNQVRIYEHKFLMNNGNQDRELYLPENLQLDNYHKILIVDDAVDSGYTLKNVVDKLEKNNSSAKIYSLAVVVTDKNAVKIPDYYLYSDVLIRFPWSLDG
ncbi:phosphoribosyltransferase family protein [Empedobacter sp. UBA7248]|uniref:phosphoribosyltransferase family protein n=1 Tax=Empedobacter sp. UBA7248 TaxID=1946448 RepID=UPI0025BF17AE|nr:phosphoribosyltransferase family protein [Empedobacter sp. UBA7248]